MKLIVNHSSMQPIYEQIVDQVKDKIMHGELAPGRRCRQYVRWRRN